MVFQKSSPLVRTNTRIHKTLSNTGTKYERIHGTKPIRSIAFRSNRVTNIILPPQCYDHRRCNKPTRAQTNLLIILNANYFCVI